MPRGERVSDRPLLLGVRHHGPGSARAVRAALVAHEPKVLLVEGPPEADAVVRLAGERTMVPPVALLAHAVDEPGRAAFWPFAAFSPEWVAISWAMEQGVEVRFVDLPAAHSLALPRQPEAEPELKPEAEHEGRAADAEAVGDPDGEEGEESSCGGGAASDLRIDPLAVLARTAGYDDPERWWEDVVEHRGAADRQGPDAEPDAREQTLAPFTALEEAMTALRETHDDGGHSRDLVREAHMRLRLREARKEFGDDAVAVVCGAWHVPALREKHAVTADRGLLKGLPKLKVDVTWVPWTHRRLARHSGYGAGITSPGWYGHLFETADRPLVRWMTRVAELLRAEDHPVSSAHVIESVRLAESLAALRGRPLAGLTETLEAVRAVMCEGSQVPLALIEDRLIVGDALGEVPDEAPAVPLQRDLTRLQRSLRLKPEAAERALDLDLRKETDAARSLMLHRLSLLGIAWGTLDSHRSRNTGTFRESWRLSWEPELSVRTAEAGIWGTTLATAAGAKAITRASEAQELGEVTLWAERCLLAGLDDALPQVMRELADRAALDSDVGRLAKALPALVRSVRYGDVRGTDSAMLRRVAEGLAERICVGLPPACTGLDADGAAALREHLDAVQHSVAMLADEGLTSRWRAVLRSLSARESVAALLRGRCARLLLDEGELAADDAERLLRLALSTGAEPADAAGWVEGFLSGGGMLLLHDERLLALIDGWLASVSPTAFEDVLPLLRRTFSAFEPGVRSNLGQIVRRGTGGRGAPADDTAYPGFGSEPDADRSAAVLPTLRHLLGDSLAVGGPTPAAATPVQDPVGASR
ncbi:DUF5682 family protein [Streptomyces sp. XM4193]|uniref:DUF5682 family protein n=1 Tax=Streptomyces sp. XM4193 TaxID=2929782 RepID=UPI001FF9113A|nr:DUF5682 family protein [Streptomyces sp. XM4193]MCK1795526.1 DUF5682 family protein [Streptomyces sp. XM4193]